MQLTPEQEAMARDGTPAQATALRILLALGKIYGADRLIPITSAHVAGASFKTVGQAGLAFIEEFSATARVKVRTTVNPIGMDENSWRDVGIPEEFAAQQQRILEAYRRMGVEESWSCTPYLIGNRPERG
jgi:predicted aconitase